MVRKNTQVNSTSRDLSTVGGRLLAERERLNVKQGDLCVRVGVSKSTQIKYEGGDNFPDTRYLDKLEPLGFDVMYILTGTRSADALSAEHQNLIDAYQAAPESLQRAVFAALLSPYKREWDKARVVPGYFQHEILGEDDVRYEAYRATEEAPPTEKD